MWFPVLLIFSFLTSETWAGVANHQSKSLLFSGWNFNLNPYDPIARVTGHEIWKRLFKKNIPSDQFPDAAELPQMQLGTAQLFHFLLPKPSFYQIPSISSTAITTTTSTTTTSTAKPMSSENGSMKPIIPQTPATMMMTMTVPTPTPSGTVMGPSNATMTGTKPTTPSPSTNQLLDCIDWLMEWLQVQNASTINAGSGSRFGISTGKRNKNRTRFEYTV